MQRRVGCVGPARPVYATAGMGGGPRRGTGRHGCLGTGEAGNGPEHELLVELQGPTGDRTADQVGVVAFELDGAGDHPAPDQLAKARCERLDPGLDAVGVSLERRSVQHPGTPDLEFASRIASDAPWDVGVRPHRVGAGRLPGGITGRLLPHEHERCGREQSGGQLRLGQARASTPSARCTVPAVPTAGLVHGTGAFKFQSILTVAWSQWNPARSARTDVGTSPSRRRRDARHRATRPDSGASARCSTATRPLGSLTSAGGDEGTEVAEHEIDVDASAYGRLVAAGVSWIHVSLDGARPGTVAERFRALLDELPEVEQVTLQGLGEPLLAPDLDEMIETATTRGIEVGFNTNGMLLTPTAMRRERVGARDRRPGTWRTRGCKQR